MAPVNLIEAHSLRFLRVMSVKIQENKILVTMDIDEDLIIGNNSKATLSSNDFLGSKAIILSIGDINEPLSDGDTISAEIDGGLSELLEKATPITDNLGITISRLNDILSSLRGSGDMITTTLDNLNDVLLFISIFISFRILSYLSYRIFFIEDEQFEMGKKKHSIELCIDVFNKHCFLS